MSTPSDYLVIGTAPRPTSGAELASALHATLVSLAADTTGATVAGIESAVIEADLTGADVSRLDIDLSRVVVTIDNSVTGSGKLETLASAMATQDATIGELRVHANPITISGVEFVLDSAAEAVPFVWAEDSAGRLAIGERPGAAKPTRVRATVEADRDALIAAIVLLAEDSLAEAGVSVSDVTVESESFGPREATITLTARLSRGILAATATASAHAKIDDAMVLHLSDARVSSRNPLVAALLLTVRQRVEEAAARPIDLQEMMPAPLRLKDIAVEIDERVRIQLELG